MRQGRVTSRINVQDHLNPEMDIQMLTQTQSLTQFRNKIYSCFKKHADSTMNLLDAISSYGHQARSIVELSEAKCFKRQYSSITDAIADGLPEVDWNAIDRYIFDNLSDTSSGKPPCFLVDCTPNPRPFARKLKDRSITHSPNPAPSNKPICVGHSYSCVALLPTDPIVHDKKWLIPLCAKRVPSDAKGNELGMQQILDHMTELGLEDQLTVSVGDSLYGSENCRAKATSRSNLLHIFRVRNNRNIYHLPTPDAQPKGRGRKKEYGILMSLSKPETHQQPDANAETTWQARNGKIYTVNIDSWENMMFRGSESFRSSQHPMTLVRVRIVDANGKALFKRPMWVSVIGKLRQKVCLLEIYRYYQSRYNIEHFFRFGKTKLLLAGYQTSELLHDEQWWQLCLLAYNQLHVASPLALKQPKPWERYLPAYCKKTDTTTSLSTPSQTQRDFSRLLDSIGTPARPCVPRGRISGRKKGECLNRRPEQPIIFKSKKREAGEQKTINPEIENKTICSNPEDINFLVRHTLVALQKFNVTTTIFTQMLLNSS